jgi:hypothetical protein
MKYLYLLLVVLLCGCNEVRKLECEYVDGRKMCQRVMYNIVTDVYDITCIDGLEYISTNYRSGTSRSKSLTVKLDDKTNVIACEGEGIIKQIKHERKVYRK